MTKFKFLLLLHVAVFSFALTARAQRSALKLTNVYFSDPRTGWIVGTRGSAPVVLKTADFGGTWQRVSGLNDFLNEIRFADTKTGWAVGAAGKIYATSDGGETWTAQRSGTTETLWGLSVVDRNRIWVSGNHGVLLSTEDSGATWLVHNVGLDIGLTDVAFVGSKVGWVVGYGTILSTQDAGVTWQVKGSGEWKQLSSVSFANERIGWITTVGSTILRTMDGGVTWQEIIVPGIGVVVSMSSIDSTHAWAAISTGEVGDVAHIPGIEKLSSDSSILASVNGGNTWNSVLHIKSRHNHRSWIYNMFFLDRAHGWAVGGGGLFLRTIDGGKHWKKKFLAPG